MAAAIAIGLSHPLGVGNSHFRIGTAARRWVNHVPFGCWQRGLFDRIGYFDEELERAQDVEFNARLLNHGGRILLLPDLTSTYHARRTLRQLGRMMYQYGYFKPLVARKAGKILTARQLVPALFVLGVAGTLGLAPWLPAAAIAFGVVLGTYGILLGAVALRLAPRLGFRAALALIAVFPTMHVTYGMGYLWGIRSHFLRPAKTRGAAARMALSR
jgi:hypothetical protein